MENQVPDTVKTLRSSRLIQLSNHMSKEYRKSMLGRDVEILFEDSKVIEGRRFQLGHTREYIKIAKETHEDLNNNVIDGTIADFLTDDIMIIN